MRRLVLSFGVVGPILLVLFFGPSISLSVACPLNINTPYKTAASPSVWYVTSRCTKVPIPNSKIYFSYFSSWSDLSITSKALLNNISDDTLSFLPWGPRRSYENGTLAKTADSPRVYLLLNGMRYHISNEHVFQQFGLSWNWIEDVDTHVFDRFEESLTTLQSVGDLPQGVMVAVDQNPQIYQVDHVVDGTIYGQEQETLENAESLYRQDRIFHLEDSVTIVPTKSSGSGGWSMRVFGQNPQPSPSPSPAPSPSSVTSLSLSYTAVATQTPGIAFSIPLVIENSGDTDVTSIVVSTTIPTYFTYTAASSSVTFSCSDGSPVGTTCTTTLATLSSGSSSTITFGVTPTSTHEGTTTFAAEILSYVASTDDSDLSDNSATSSVIVDGSPDLYITTLTPSLATSTPSTTIQFTAAYGNSGTIMSTGTVLTTSVPTGTVFLSASSTSGWSCANGSTAGTSCVYDIPSLAISATGSAIFAVRSLGNYVSTITTTMVISDDGTYGSDSNSGNNTVTATSSAEDYLLSLSDEFNGSSVDSSWSVLNPSYFISSVSTGSLHMTPQVDVAWFNTDSAGSYYKTLTSYFFKITSLVRARNTSPSDFSAAANGEFHLGGFNIRNTNTTTLNYVHIAVGDPNDVDGAGNGAPNATEVKTTVNNVTTYNTQAIAANPGYNTDPETRGDSQLRICRVNQVFYFYRRPVDGGAWSLIGTVDRSVSVPLPETVNVGPVAYVYQGAPGLRASFDYIHFSAAVASQSDCTTD